MIALASLAHAQEEACPGRLAVAEVTEVLSAVQQALAALDGDRAAHLLDEVHEVARCLGEVVDPDTLGRYAANHSVVSFYAQDFEESRRWAQLAVATTGMATAGTVVGPERWWADYGAVAVEVGTAAGGIAAPPGGLVVLDGRALTTPTAATAVPHLLQLVDRKGRVLTSQWIDGTAFPEGIRSEQPNPDPPPRWWVEPPPLSVVTAPAAPVEAPPAGEVVFDGVVATDGCPFEADPQDVEASSKRVRIGEQTYSLRGEGLVTFRVLLRTCGEFRASRRFAKWAVAKGPLSPERELRDAWVEALTTPEPRKKKHGG